MTAPVAPIFSTTVQGDDTLISSGDFFPTVSLHDFKSVMRVIDKNDDPVLAALQSSLFDVYSDLKSWSLEQAALGYETLAAVPADIDLESMFRLAVYSGAKGKLVDMYRDIDTTNTGHDRADALEQTAHFYYREQRSRMRSIRGKAALTAELI